MAFGAMHYYAALVWLGAGLSCASHAASPAQRAPAVATAPESRPAPVATRPKLRVGTSGDYAPFSTRDAAGAVHGFDAELAGGLAKDLGFELQWVSVRWPTLQAQLQNGEFDVAMSGVTWQPARAVTGYLTRAVARGGPCVLGDEGVQFELSGRDQAAVVTG